MQTDHINRITTSDQGNHAQSKRKNILWPGDKFQAVIARKMTIDLKLPP